MTADELSEKFRGLTSRHLATESVERLLTQLWQFEELEHAGDIIKMTCI